MNSFSIDSLIAGLVSKGFPEDSKVLKAMRLFDRSNFVPEDSKYSAYLDIPLSIGYSQTISQPYTVAFMLTLLNVRKGDNILDIGSGSGWTTALLSYLTGDKGTVIGVELIPELVALGQYNINKYALQNAGVIQANNEELGIPGKVFDRILVGAAGDELDETILSQLAIGGVLVIPIRNSIWSIEKTRENTYIKKEYPGFVFVPLITSK